MNKRELYEANLNLQLEDLKKSAKIAWDELDKSHAARAMLHDELMIAERQRDQARRGGIMDKYTELTLTASAYNRKVNVELPKDSDANTVFEAFKTLMVGLTFSEHMFNDAVVNYFYEHELDKNVERGCI